jgi:hypothetical protein
MKALGVCFLLLALTFVGLEVLHSRGNLGLISTLTATSGIYPGFMAPLGVALFGVFAWIVDKLELDL